MNKTPKPISPQLLQDLERLQETIKKFFVLHKSATAASQKSYHQKALLLKKIYLLIKQELSATNTVPDWIKNSNCAPDEIPARVREFNNARDPQILNVKMGILRKYKKEFAEYLWKCYGVELTWNKQMPQLNIGEKYNLRNVKGNCIVYELSPDNNAALGEQMFLSNLKRYNKLKGFLLQGKLRDNVRHLEDVYKAKRYLVELEKIMKKEQGGLPDFFYNIFNHELRQKHQKQFNDAIKDWQEGAMLQQAIKEIEDAYANVTEREADGFAMDEEPEPLDSQKERGHWEDFSDLPLSKKGEGDEAPLVMNDIQQGETGDCYMLAAAAALAKVAPQLLTGENGIIQDKGEYLEVTLYMKPSKFEYDYEPVVIKVSKKVLVDANNQPLNQKFGDGELWGVALEKALAQYRGGYDNIVGGFPEQGIGMLTGKRAKIFDFKAGGEQGSLEFLKQCLQKDYPVTFATKGKRKAEAERQITVNGVEQILLERHNYALEKVENGLIHLYNPHGKRHLQIDFEALNEYFRAIYYVEL